MESRGIPFEDTAPKLAATVVTLTVLALTVLPLRFYIRIRNKTWGMDDWTMAIATVPFTALTTACLGGSFRGIGVHEDRLTESQKMQGLQWFFFFEVFYCAAIIPIKMSIVFMLMRIASPKDNYVKSLYGVTFLFTTMNLVALFYIIFQCTPVQYAWNTNIPGGHCQPGKILADIYYADTAINIVTDWFCAFLPIPLLWNIQLNRNSKLSVAFLLGLGALASLSACIRLNYTINLTDGNDYLYGVGDIVIWGYAENGVGLIVGCISTLRPLFRRIFHLGDSRQDPSIKLDPVWHGSDRCTYREFDGAYGVHLGKVTGITTIKGGTSRGNSSDSASESEEHILPMGTMKVEKTVDQDVS